MRDELRAGERTAVFLLELFPMLPSRPIDWLTTTPIVERVSYPTPHGQAEGDLYRPGTGGSHPGVVVCLGVVPFEVDHPQVPRLGRALARAGFAALIYWSPAMRDLRLVPDDVEGIALAYRSLIERPGIDSSRSGLLGACVGGSFAIMAAADAAIRDRVAFVSAFAPYSSMRTFVRDIASATRSNGAMSEPWPVDPLTWKVFVRSMTDILAPAEATSLREAFVARRGGVDTNGLSALGSSIAGLLAGGPPDAIERMIDDLPQTMRERLDLMSPLCYLADIRSPLFVVGHDRDDLVIPVGESRRLQAAIAGRPGARYTEFAMFEHADPTKRHLSPPRMARELAKFFRYAYPMFRQAV